MDNRHHDRELFSRPTTPPQNQGQPTQSAAVPGPQQHPANNSSSDLIDSLFHHIISPQDQQSQQSGSLDASQPAADANRFPSDSVSAAQPSMDEQQPSVAPAQASVAPSVQDRQKDALLSLLNAPPSGSVRTGPLPPVPQQPQQVPTPPGSSRSNASPAHPAENRKFLLDLLGSSAPRNSVAESQRSSHSVHSAPSPPFNLGPHEGEYRSFNQHSQQHQHGQHESPRVQTIAPAPPPAQTQPPVPSPPVQQQPQQHTQQFSPQQVAQQVPLPPSQPLVAAQQAPLPPSPRRSMFEFMSPFDHLSALPPVNKKKAQTPPVPAPAPAPAPTSAPAPAPAPLPAHNMNANEEQSSWGQLHDPKRQSVENLLDTLTRGPPPVHPLQPQPQPMQSQPIPYEPYMDQGYPISLDVYNQYQAHVPPPPLPPKPPVHAPPHHASSPRSSPPKASARAPQQQVQAVSGMGKRDKDGSPGPGSRARNKNVQQAKAAGKSQSSPSTSGQTIIFDVSKMQDEVQAPRDSVKSTAIALVRQEAVFLPGTTIGATHWVAYAMTRGRVRVISRSSGDRTLLQLPSLFPSTTSVIDMAVFGSRLAGITSDGGFVLWQLPDTITDDVPGDLLLCIPPTNDPVDALRAVKWHPKEPDTLAIASDTKIFVIHLSDIMNLRGPVPHSDLRHISALYTVPSMICAFDFDPLHYSLAAITEDSSLSLWNLQDTIPYATHKVRGEDVPSYLTFVDGGIVVGRKNGTIFQLLAHSSKTVLSTIKFTNSQMEDPDMFGHANYDSRIQTLWIANSRRESIIGCKLNIESSYVNGEEQVRGQFEQLVEFTGPKATIHFVILTGDSDPHGDEAHAACIAAKLSPGELALVAFSVHSSGVDQVLIRKEWFDSALMSAPSRFPLLDLPPPPTARAPSPTHSSITATKPPRGPLPVPPSGVPNQVPLQAPPPPPPVNPGNFAPPRGRTPPSNEVEPEYNSNGNGNNSNKMEEEPRAPEPKSKPKSKNVNWKEKDDNKETSSNVGGGNKEKSTKSSEANLISDAVLTQVLAKNLRVTEDALHNRMSRLISKEMEKQNQRLEEARHHAAADDFTRQETILKLISSELTRNTTRVVEMAVKSEVQASVLPSLESIMKHEVRSALNEQVGRNLAEIINQSLPLEIEKIFSRPDISSHFAHVISSNIAPLIDRQVKDAVMKNFMPLYSQQATTFHQELVREVRGELNGLKQELNVWKSDTMRGHENSIRDLDLTVRALSDQVKFLTMNLSSPVNHAHHIQSVPQSQGSPAGSMQPGLGPVHRQPPQQMNTQPSSSYSHPQQYGPAPPPPAPQPQPAQGPVHQQWFGIAAPQASHPATIPQPIPQPAPQPQAERSPPIKPDQWDEIYLGVLHTQNSLKLRDLLSHTNPDVIMPLNGQPLVSQAVILTLVHRLASIVGDTSPNDESLKSTLWWLQRVIAVLRPEDKLISEFVPRVLPNVQQLLSVTKQRLTILPGGGTPVMETARTLSELSDVLSRKVSVLQRAQDSGFSS
ncbi:hypothetical protein BKA70DRAFT_1248170 [Coprinopsis sp. MPI-PUGE-AT-0042]|nr:hypothetical protein BKA70DRAFT_1248170 [Coprinopsis sp. MPI-PUGE-AT-0042]